MKHEPLADEDDIFTEPEGEEFDYTDIDPLYEYQPKQPKKKPNNPERKSRNLGIECTCYHKCHHFISDKAKVKICDYFWNLCDLNRQRDFIVSHVGRKRCISGGGDSRRHFTFAYHLTYNRVKHKVCKNFFLQTLNVSEKMVRTTFIKRGGCE